MNIERFTQDEPARYNAEMDEHNKISYENREKPWLPLQPGEER